MLYSFFFIFSHRDLFSCLQFKRRNGNIVQLWKGSIAIPNIKQTIQINYLLPYDMNYFLYFEQSWILLSAKPAKLNEDYLCLDENLIRDPWPWIGRIFISLFSLYIIMQIIDKIIMTTYSIGLCLDYFIKVIYHVRKECSINDK